MNGRIQLGVFVVSGLAAGLAAFLGASYYGSASSSDANGYELYVIAAAVVGGASLMGGKGSAINATLGALLLSLGREESGAYDIVQGVEMGRPSRLTVTARRAADGIRSTVGGGCVPMLEGEATLG